MPSIQLADIMSSKLRTNMNFGHYATVKPIDDTIASKVLAITEHFHSTLFSSSKHLSISGGQQMSQAKKAKSSTISPFQIQ